MNETKIWTPSVIIVTIIFSPIWVPVALVTLALKVSAVAAKTIWYSK